MQKEWTRAISELQRRAPASRAGLPRATCRNPTPAKATQNSESQRRISRKHQHFCHVLTSAIDAHGKEMPRRERAFAASDRCGIATKDPSSWQNAE